MEKVRIIKETCQKTNKKPQRAEWEKWSSMCHRQRKLMNLCLTAQYTGMYKLYAFIRRDFSERD